MTNKHDKEYELKLDANDQAEVAQNQLEKFRETAEAQIVNNAGLKELQDRIRAAQEIPSPGKMASEIAGNFYQVASLFHSDLRRQIIDAIETSVKSAVAQCLKEFKDI